MAQIIPWMNQVGSIAAMKVFRLAGYAGTAESAGRAWINIITAETSCKVVVSALKNDWRSKDQMEFLKQLPLIFIGNIFSKAILALLAPGLSFTRFASAFLIGYGIKKLLSQEMSLTRKMFPKSEDRSIEGHNLHMMSEIERLALITNSYLRNGLIAAATFNLLKI